MRYKIGDKVKLKKYDDLKSMYEADAYGNIYVETDKINSTLGNDNYPWCTTDGLLFSYDLV